MKSISIRAAFFACCIALSLLAVPSAQAQSGIIPPPPASCNSLVRSCAQMTDDELWAAAFINPANNPASNLGTCYFHDNSTCPTCACPFYVKISYLPPPSGWDGTTGCFFNRADALKILREICSQGRCGCPRQSYSGACIQVITYGKDPVTGTCCQYPTPCDVPNGWAQFNTLHDCQN